MSSEINLIMAESPERSTDAGVIIAVVSPDRSTESGVIVAEASPARSTESSAIVAAAPITENRPTPDLMCRALVSISKDSDQMLPMLQSKAIFCNTDDDLAVFDKFKEFCGDHKWCPTVAPCTKALVLFDRHLGGRVSGNTAKMPDNEL